MIRRPPRSTLSSSSAASDVYKRQRHEDAVEAPVGDDQRGARSRGLQPREKAFGPNGGARRRLAPGRSQVRFARPPARSHARNLSLDLARERAARPDAPVEFDEVGFQRNAEAERSRHDGRGFASPDQRAGPHGVDRLTREADREIFRLAAPPRRKRRVEAGALQRAGEIALALAMPGDSDEHATGFYEKRVLVSSSSRCAPSPAISPTWSAPSPTAPSARSSRSDSSSRPRSTTSSSTRPASAFSRRSPGNFLLTRNCPRARGPRSTTWSRSSSTRGFLER